jgi:hypothetical protein
VLRSGDEDFCEAAGGGLLADGDFDVAVECGEEIHEAFDGKAVEAVVGESGDFGLVDVQAAGGLGLRKALMVKDAIDGYGQAHLGLFFVGAGEAEISENVAGAGDYVELVFSHGHVAPRNAVLPGEAAERSVRYPAWVF